MNADWGGNCQVRKSRCNHNYERGKKSIKNEATESLRKKRRIQVQGISYRSFGATCLYGSTFYSRAIRVILPSGAAIHANSDVNTRVTSRRWLGVRGVVTVRIPRVLSVGLHNNWHIRAMMRDDIGRRVRHSAIWKIRRIVLGMGKWVALTLVLLSRMRRWGLHRDVVRGIRRSLSGLVHARHGRVLSVDQRRVAHRAHEGRGGRRVPGGGHSSE